MDNVIPCGDIDLIDEKCRIALSEISWPDSCGEECTDCAGEAVPRGVERGLSVSECAAVLAAGPDSPASVTMNGLGEDLVICDREIKIWSSAIVKCCD
ncbi:hypothetical protein J6590_007440 [Homalodisca vitripennis]|nr:hypothetical protein J6590_007440 [Homalodisca vitripennis]